MRKDILIFTCVTAVSLVAAALGHAYCREFCMLFKPMAWPFVALAYIAWRHLRTKKAK